MIAVPKILDFPSQKLWIYYSIVSFPNSQKTFMFGKHKFRMAIVRGDMNDKCLWYGNFVFGDTGQMT